MLGVSDCVIGPSGARADQGRSGEEGRHQWIIGHLSTDDLLATVRRGPPRAIQVFAVQMEQG
jgi:hypothetical protein